MGSDPSHYPSLISDVNSSTTGLAAGNSFTFTGIYQDCSNASHLMLEASTNQQTTFTIRWSEDSAGLTSYEEDTVSSNLQTVSGSAYNSSFIPISPIKGKYFRIKANSGSTTVDFFICRVRIVYEGFPFSVNSSGQLVVSASFSPSGTQDVNLIKVGGTSVTIGRATMAASIPVAIASDQAAIPITDNSASLTVDAPVATPVFVSLSDGSAALVGQKAMAASVPVVIASDQSILSTNISRFGNTVMTIGQKTMANSIPIVIASDQASIPVAAILTAETTKVIGTIRIASGGVASGSLASGSIASGAIASGAVASGAFASGSIAAGAVAAGAVAAGATSFVKLEDVASADADAGVACLAVRKATPANTSGTDGDYEFLQISAGRLWASATIDAALPAGTNAIGKLAANSGVDIGDVDVTSTTFPTLVTAVFQVEGTVAGTALTGSYASVLDLSDNTKIVEIRNSCNQTILLSFDGGTTLHKTLESRVGALTIDLGVAGLKTTAVVSAKHAGVAPTSGSIYVTGIS